jgi:DNA-damage-inducible protein J
MSSITSSLNVNVNAETKKEASKVLDELGLNMTTAINIYLKQIVKHNGIPFEVKNRVPNHKLKKTLKETDKIIKGKVNSKAYSSAEDLMKDILDN